MSTLLILGAVALGAVALFAPKVFRAWKAKVIAEALQLKARF